jgi:hypothetical protein
MVGPDEPVRAFLAAAADRPPDDLIGVVRIAGELLGAESARMLVADYGQSSFLELGEDGPTAARVRIDATLAGRAFIDGDVVVSDGDPPTVWLPLREGDERLGVLELVHRDWTSSTPELVLPLIRVLVLTLISKRRSTDLVHRSRRAARLSLAAEIQWDLLPPLSCSTERVSVSGVLEPAYEIGGDSFDYAFNPSSVEFAIVDAVGHGMAAVLASGVAIDGLRNARREGVGLEGRYLATSEVLGTQFGRHTFVTGQFGQLDPDTGILTWINAGHPLPLVVRDGDYVGELDCRPSIPMGIGGPVRQVATERLHRGDRILFYTDGVTESKSPGGDAFGRARLADLLVRATREAAFVSETVRRLSRSVLDYNGAGLKDDATLLLLEYHGPPTDD